MSMVPKPLRFLLLEDSPGDAALARSVVQRMAKLSPEVVHVESLADALAALDREAFDLVLTDLNVPDSDGLATCRALLAHKRQAPVVVLTGSHDVGDAVLALGAQDYLDKGKFDPVDIARLLRYARQRHALNQELRASERRSRHLLTASPVVIYVSDATASGGTTWISENVETIFGHAASSFTNPPGYWLTCVHADDRERVMREAGVAAAAGSGVTEYRFHHGAGRMVWVRDEMKLVNSDGRAPELIGCMIDITEQKRLEQELRLAMEAAQASNSAKGIFLSNMSHELRTPLNAVIGFAELLRDLTGGDLTQKQERWVENILTSGRHLLSLINDVLDLAKIDAGKMTLDVSLFDPAAVIVGVIDLVRPIAAKREVEVTFASGAALPQLSADQMKLKQVLYNLLANAIKFTPARGSVSVHAEGLPDGAGLRLRVDDTGIGLDQGDVELIFEDFTQIEGPGSGKQPGTGLGLGLARRMISLHGGQIWAESAGLGKGCSLIVELPQAPVEPPAVAEQRARQLVLVIEDSDLDRELVVALLERGGYEVEAALTAEEGLRLARLRTPDLVLMDLGLPDLDGLEATRRLKRDPRTAAVPVIAISARATRADSAAALAAGCAIHIPKPFDTRTLRTVVHEILRPARRPRTSR